MVGRFGSPWLGRVCALWTANTYNMMQLELKLKAKTKRRDPASAGVWGMLRIRNTSLHSKMALRRRSTFVNTQHIMKSTRNSELLDSGKCELRLWVLQDRICDDVVGVPMWGDKFKVSGCLVPTRWCYAWCSRVDPGRSGDLSGSTNHA